MRFLTHPARFLPGVFACVFLFAFASGDLRADDFFGDGERLAEATYRAEARVQELAVDHPAAFAAILRQSFGARLSAEQEQEWIAQAASRKLPLPERILLVSEKVFPGAAAYVSEPGGTMLLNEAFRSDLDELTELILHEWGHHLDALLGEGDAPHDEGEIFYLGVQQGRAVPPTLLHFSDAHKNDRFVIQFEGRDVEVECFWGGFKRFFKKVGNSVANVAKKVGNGVGNIAKATYNGVKKAATSTWGGIVNVGATIGNTINGAAMGIASGAAHLTGNKQLGDSLAARSRSTFKAAGTAVKDFGNNAVNALSSAGNLINETAAELDKIVPGLGTVANVAIGMTPAGPAVAAAKGFADVANVIKGGGNAGQVMGALGFAALDYGGAKIGRVAKGVNAAKGAGIARQGASRTLLGATKAAPTGFFKNVAAKVGAKLTAAKNAATRGLGKVKNLADSSKLGKLKKALDNSKYAKATKGEISRGKNLIAHHPTRTKVVGVLDKLKTVNSVVRFKDFIPGRDRTADGILLGTGGNSWNKHINQLKDDGLSFLSETAGDSLDLWQGIGGIFTPGKSTPATGTKVATGKGGISGTGSLNPNVAVIDAVPSSAKVRLSGRISGTDEKGNNLGVIPNAKIILTRADKTTAGVSLAGPTGFYMMPNLAPGHYTYEVSADGFTPENAGRGLRIPAGGPGDHLFSFILTRGKSEFPPAGKLQGRVAEYQGARRMVMAGVYVAAKQVSGGSALKEAITDQNGDYLFDLPAGSWKIAASPLGMVTSMYPGGVTVKANESQRADFEFREKDRKPAFTSNMVFAIASLPVATNAPQPVIRFVNVATGEVTPGKVVHSDAALIAEFEFFQGNPVTPLKAGTYRAEGELSGFPPAVSSQKLVSANQMTSFDLAFVAPKKPAPKVRPELQIFTRHKADRILDAAVTLVKKDPPAGEGKAVNLSTGSKGFAKTLLDDGEGVYSVAVKADGYQDYVGEVVMNNTGKSLTIHLDPIPRPAVAITVRNSAGAVLPGVDLRLVDKTRGKSLSEAAQLVSDGAGTGSIPLKDGYGAYALVASLAGYHPSTEELSLLDDPAAPGRMAFEKTITLYKEGESRPANFTGTLVELGPGHDKAYKDGKKIPNAQIVFQSAGGTALPAALASPLRTGTEGDFAAKMVPEGTYTASISAEGYEEYSGPLKVAFGMEPLLLSLKPRNAERDNWIRMILTEGWGDLLPSRQFHDSGTKADPADSNVDYALGLSALQAKDKATSVPAFALAVGKVSPEKWWDRACEAHLWTLMHHQETASAVSEIRRIIPGVYGGRAESDESRATAYLCGVAVGVLKGPWATEGIGQLDSEITAALKGTHLTSYEAGKQSVAGRFTQLSEAEDRAKKELADAAEGERARLLADLEKRVQELRSALDANAAQQQAQNQAFTNYRTTAETSANTHTARLTQLVAQAETLRTEIAQLQAAMNNGMQAQANARLTELQGGLNANIAAQENELRDFTNYRNGVEPAAAAHVNRLNEISAELQQLAADFAKAQANPGPQMAGGGMAGLDQVEGRLSAAINQTSLLTERMNELQRDAQAQINGYNTQLQEIADGQNARNQRMIELNALSPHCAVCANYAEKPVDCEDCARVRREREAEIVRLNQEFTLEQNRDGEIRGLLAGVQNNYEAALATYNEQIAPMQAQEAALREEYNRLVAEANKPAAPNPMLAEIQNRDAALRAEYQEKEGMHATLIAEYGRAEADHLARINQLKAAEADLRAQMANAPAAAPGAGGEAALIAEKTASYTRIQQEYADAEKQLAAVQADYLREGEKHQQEIAKLTELATTLTNQLNETGTQMGSVPNPGTMPAGGQEEQNRTSMAFATYLDYPLEQRRQELLGWVTRGANLSNPAVR